MTPCRTIGARIIEARGVRNFDPVAGTVQLWTALRQNAARILHSGRADAAWYGAAPLDDRVLRDIGVTRFGIREAAVTEPLELESAAARRDAAPAC